MPDTDYGPPAPSSSSPSISDIMGSTGSAFEPPSALKAQLGDVAKREASEQKLLFKQTSDRLDADQKHVQEAYDHQGVHPSDIKPFDAQGEAQKMHDPLQRFGSLGTVVGLVASAFSRRPALNAMTAVAASMEAIKKDDADNYTRAFEAWKVNSELLFKRSELEQKHFQQSIELMKTDLEAGTTKALMNARQFGAEKDGILIEHGYIKEWYEAQAAKYKAVEEQAKIYAEVMPKMEQFKSLQADPRWKSGDAKQRSEAWLDAMKPEFRAREEGLNYRQGRTLTNQLTLAGIREETALKVQKNITERQEIMKGLDEKERMNLLEAQQQGRINLEEMRQQWQSARQTDKQDFQGRENQANRESREKIAANRPAAFNRFNKLFKELGDQNREQGMSDVEADEKALKEVERLQHPMTGNRRDDLEAEKGRYEHSIGVIDDATHLLETHTAVSGLAGMGGRKVEALLDILGASDETARDEFRRDINLLHATSARLITESRSRPLSAEEKELNQVIGGLSMGDTWNRTRTSLLKVKELYQRIQKDIDKRMGDDAPAKSSVSPERPQQWTPPPGDEPVK